MSKRGALELPTLLLALLVHAGWLGLTWLAARATLPQLVALAPFAGFVVAWHGSLQHEIIHGHPTRVRSLNTLLASLPVALWLPFGVYREQHLAHHRSVLTDPSDDPESFYVTRAWWDRAGPVRRALARAQTTLVGRLVLGPPAVIARFVASELRAIARGEWSHARAWTAHLAGLAVLVAWLELGAGLSLTRYALVFVYPGVALTLLRSFAEHRPAPTPGHGNVVIEAGPVASLLYLNNNLHAVHHAAPAVPWYELRARYRVTRREVLAENGGYVLPGYLWLAARYGFRAKDSPIHPGSS